MTSSFESINRVVWREGALLAPQHLQQQERHLHNQIRLCFSASHPYPWGILEIDIDEGPLNQGEFQLKKLRAILPDGLYVSCGDNATRPETRSFVNAFHELDDSILVYLAIPLEHPGIRSFDETPGDLSPTSRKTRYCVHTERVYDQTQEREESEIQTATPRCKVMFGAENRDDYVSMPIARIINTGKSYILDENYVPPALCLSGGGPLQRRATAFVSKLHKRVEELQDYRITRHEQNAEFNPRDTAIYMWLFALSSRCLSLRAINEAPMTSPFELYLKLIELAGQLGVLVPTQKRLPDIKYNHTNLQETFAPLFDLLLELIGFVFRKSYRSLSLTRRSDGMWLSEIKDDILGLHGDYVLAITTNQSAEQIARKTPDLAKMASYSKISQLVHSATRGAPLRPLHQPPETIPYRKQTVYFEIDRSSSHWQAIVNERNIAVYVGAPIEHTDMEVQLLVGLAGTRESIVPT